MSAKVSCTVLRVGVGSNPQTLPDNFSQGTWYPKLTKGLSFVAAESTPISCAQGTQLVFDKGR